MKVDEVTYRVVYPSEDLAVGNKNALYVDVQGPPDALYLAILKKVDLSSESIDSTEINYHQRVRNKCRFLVLPARGKKKSVIFNCQQKSNNQGIHLIRLDIPTHWTCADFQAFFAHQQFVIDLFKSLPKRKKRLSYCEVIKVESGKESKVR